MSDSDTKEGSPTRKRSRNLLHGLRIHIVDINVPLAKLKILAKVVAKNGGTIVEKVEDLNTIILADFAHINDLRAAYAASKMKRQFEYSEEQCLKMCRLEWLTLSLKHGSLLPRDHFLLTNTNHNSNSEQTDQSDLDVDPHNSDLLAPGYVNDGWPCRHRCPLDHPNRDITDCLGHIMHHRRVTSDARSELSYAKAIAALAGYPRRVSGTAEAGAIKGIGPKIAGFVGEFLECGKVTVVDDIFGDKHYQKLRSLCDIHGVGGKTAERWLAIGIDTVEAVKERMDKDLKLSEQQRLGVLYYDDLQCKMSRRQVDDIYKLVRSVLPADCELHETGGYRRGKPLSNDVDMLVLSKDVNILDLILSKLDRHVVGVLQMARSNPPNLPTRTAKPANPGGFDHLGKCLLLLKAPGDTLVRRVDIIQVPCREVLPWAQLGWTGSRMFERSIRLYADRLCGIHLSSDGAFCKKTKTYLHADSEQDCFELLNLEYIKPEDRNC